jgi:membrane protein implicated in regulation of membrane protease activity
MESFDIEFWYWWVFAVVLMILELFAPGTFFLWMGVAAIVIGAVVGLLPSLIWEIQVLGFSVFSVVSVLAWRVHLKNYPRESDQPLLNQRSAQYIGRVVTLDAPISDGYGKTSIDHSLWKVRGSDCPAGTRVKVVSVDGVVLIVEAV